MIAVAQLDEVVTTATGQQRKVELGNAISTLGDVGKTVEKTPINNVTDLMIAKAPGVSVLPSPVLGGAPTIRIRGISSISLSNAPIWYVDGVRYDTNNANTSSGQTPVSLLNNLSPEEIEDIEIVKGPSAATLYGTNAANGVVVITTKKGRAGATHWNWTAETRTIDDRNAVPGAVRELRPHADESGQRDSLPACRRWPTAQFSDRARRARASPTASRTTIRSAIRATR